MPSSASFLLTHFDRLAEAPGGIAKLRALVLQLAVSGSLVRSETSEPWQSLKLRQLAEVIRGVSYDKSVVRDATEDGYVPLLRANAIQGSLVFDDLVYVPASYVSKEQFVRKNDLVIAMSSGSKDLVGKAAQAQEDFPGGFGAFCGVIRFGDRVEPGYARVFVQSPLYRDAIAAEGRGIGINNLRKDSLLDLPFPLPPLAEQRRIVAKVEELMGLCDALEAAQREREAVRARLRTSALHQLASPDSDSKPAAFVLQNLLQFTSAAEDLAQLRQIVLQFAVTGRLSRSESDWRECKLGEILVYGPKNGVSPKASSVPTRTKSLSLSATTSGKFKGEYFKYVDLEPEKNSELWLCDGDILIQRSNTREYVGTAAIYRGAPNSFIYPDLMMRLRMADTVDVDFIHRVLSAPATRAYFSAAASGSSDTMPKINQEAVRNTPIPLPPLAEQRRIVAKVDELMAVLDALAATLTTARTTSERLLAATVAKLHAA